MAPEDPVRMSKELEDEINPPLSSALVTEPQAVREEIRAEDEEILHMQLAHDLEKNGDSDVVDSVASEEPTQPKVTVFDFPDGGRRAWIMVFGAWWISFCTFGFVNSFGIFEDYYSTHQLANSTPSDIAWIGSFQIFCMFCGGLFAGRIFDSHGPRWLLACGSTVFIACFFIIPECKEYWQFFLAQGVAFGIAISTIFFPSVACLSHWFRRKRALAMGIVYSGSSIGGVVWPILMSHLLSNPSIGFQWSLRIAGFINIPIVIVANITQRTRLPRRDPGPFFDFKFWKDPRFSLFEVGFFMVILGMFTPLFYIQQFAVSLGMSPGSAFYLLSIVNGSSAFGRILPGFVADRFGPFNVLVPFALMNSVTIFTWFGMTIPGLYVFCVFFGFFQGAMISVQNAAIASICRDMREIGTMMGMGGGFVAIAGLCGTPIAGAILHAQGGENFTGTAGFSAGIILAGTCFVFLARMTVAKWKVFAKV